jgi:hypothetical protein
MHPTNKLKTKLFRILKWFVAIFLTLLVVIYFLNQGFKSKYCYFHRLYKDSVNNIVLYKFETDSINYCRCSDSLILSKNQRNSFINKWNNSYPIGPCKYIPEFTLTVKMKNGNNRYFNIIGGTIKEPRTYGFKFICGEDFFSSIWDRNKKPTNY